MSEFKMPVIFLFFNNKTVRSSRCLVVVRTQTSLVKQGPFEGRLLGGSLQLEGSHVPGLQLSLHTGVCLSPRTGREVNEEKIQARTATMRPLRDGPWRFTHLSSYLGGRDHTWFNWLCSTWNIPDWAGPSRLLKDLSSSSLESSSGTRMRASLCGKRRAPCPHPSVSIPRGQRLSPVRRKEHAFLGGGPRGMSTSFLPRGELSVG